MTLNVKKGLCYICSHSKPYKGSSCELGRAYCPLCEGYEDDRINIEGKVVAFGVDNLEKPWDERDKNIFLWGKIWSPLKNAQESLTRAIDSGIEDMNFTSQCIDDALTFLQTAKEEIDSR